MYMYVYIYTYIYAHTITQKLYIYIYICTHNHTKKHERRIAHICILFKIRITYDLIQKQFATHYMAFRNLMMKGRKKLKWYNEYAELRVDVRIDDGFGVNPPSS